MQTLCTDFPPAQKAYRSTDVVPPWKDKQLVSNKKKRTFEEALLQSRGAQNVVSVKTFKIGFILVFVLFLPPNGNDNLCYAGFYKTMIALARRRCNE